MPSNAHGAEQEAAHRIFGETDPRRIREIVRRGEWTGPTRGIGLGYVQANMAIVPRSDAYDLLVFFQRNSRAFPVLDVTEAGDPEPRIMGPGADLRTDLPRYKVFRQGELTEEVSDISDLWRDDFVALLIGCSMTFEGALLANDVPLRKLEENSGACMFRTNIPMRPAGRFRGPLVVTMMPMPVDRAIRAVQITSRFPAGHGAPIHIGDPSLIGIQDVQKPDWGRTPTIKPGEVPVFWACGGGLTPAAMEAGLEIMITHGTGCTFCTDLPNEHMAVF